MATIRLRGLDKPLNVGYARRTNGREQRIERQRRGAFGKYERRPTSHRDHNGKLGHHLQYAHRLDFGSDRQYLMASMSLEDSGGAETTTTVSFSGGSSAFIGYYMFDYYDDNGGTVTVTSGRSTGLGSSTTLTLSNETVANNDAYGFVAHDGESAQVSIPQAYWFINQDNTQSFAAAYQPNQSAGTLTGPTLTATSSHVWQYIAWVLTGGNGVPSNFRGIRATSHTFASGSSTTTIGKPTGTTDGDELITITTGPSAPTSVPSGWHQECNDVTNFFVGVYSKTASSEPANYTWTYSGNSVSATIFDYYDGSGATLGVKTTACSQQASAASATPPSTTAGASNDIQGFFANLGNSKILTTEDGMFLGSLDSGQSGNYVFG